MLCVYDLSVSPPTFDFVGFLVSAERERKRRGDRHIQVVIAPGPKHGFRDDDLPPSVPERRRMLENIVKPMCALLPSCSGVEEGLPEQADFPAGWTRENRIAHYGMGTIADAFRVGCYPLMTQAKPDDELITITLRNEEYWPTRNSNRDAWQRLASDLSKRGYAVQFVDSENVARRAEIYASARLNLFVNNGPAWMCAFMPQAPGLIFKMCAPDAPCVNPEFFDRVGFPVGSQTGRAGFRIVWEADDYETLLRETLAELENPTQATLKQITAETFDHTLNNEKSVMLDQARENLKRDLPWFGGSKPHAQAALIVGGGPSLPDTLPKLRFRHERGGVIFALNGAHDWLIDRGIVPNYHVMLDSRQENVSFVQRPHPDVHYLINAYCHPDVFDALTGYHVTLWMSDMQGMPEIVEHVTEKPVCLVGGGATVMLKTMFLVYLDGYRKQHFFGVDSSYRGGKNHAYPQPMNDREAITDITPKMNGVTGPSFKCAPWMAKQAADWQKQANKLMGLGCELWVHGDGLLPWIAQQMAQVKQAA